MNIENLYQILRLSYFNQFLSYLGQANARSSFTSSNQVGGMSYEAWQHHFLLARLNLATWLSLIGYFIVMVLNLSGAIYRNEAIFDRQLLGQLIVQLCLLSCLAILRTNWGKNHTYLLFLCFAWSIGLVKPILEGITLFTESEFLSWAIIFLAQATLIPVRFYLHLISQLSFFAYYFWANGLINTNVNSKVQLINWVLGLVWVCCIGNISVYLYERLQRAEFKTRSELESAYRELETAESKYRSIFENSLDGIFQATIDGRYYMANPAMAKIYGYLNATEFIAKLSENRSQMYVDHHCHDEFRRLLYEQGEVFGFEAQVYRADGSKIWISTNAKTVRDHYGSIISFEGTVEDITERKRAQEETYKALEKEKELNQLKSRFISMTSHEFRTPLTTILASAEALEHYSQKWNEEKKLSYLHRIQNAVHQMVGLLNDILVLGKAETDQIPFNPAPIDLESFCRNLVEEMQLSIGQEHKIVLVLPQMSSPQDAMAALEAQREKMDVADTCLLTVVGDNYFSKDNQSQLPMVNINSVCMDEKLLRQIFSNLLSNAIKYSPAGTEIKLQLNYDNEKVILTVHDQGIGIPIEDQKHIFESFYRARNVGNTAGTGLGLAIVKKAVEAHQGFITCHSNENEGTTFTITLPY